LDLVIAIRDGEKKDHRRKTSKKIGASKCTACPIFSVCEKLLAVEKVPRKAKKTLINFFSQNNRKKPLHKGNHWV